MAPLSRQLRQLAGTPSHKESILIDSIVIEDKFPLWALILTILGLVVVVAVYLISVLVDLRAKHGETAKKDDIESPLKPTSIVRNSNVQRPELVHRTLSQRFSGKRPPIPFPVSKPKAVRKLTLEQRLPTREESLSVDLSVASLDVEAMGWARNTQKNIVSRENSLGTAMRRTSSHSSSESFMLSTAVKIPAASSLSASSVDVGPNLQPLEGATSVTPLQVLEHLNRTRLGSTSDSACSSPTKQNLQVLVEEGPLDTLAYLSSAEFEQHVKLVTFLGAGAQGCVYEAVYKGQKVAVKVLQPSRQVSPKAIEDFKKEVQLMGELGKHPNVVAVIGCCFEPPHTCVIMELCHNGSLWNVLHDKHLRPRFGELLQGLEVLADVMAACHERRPAIVHMDLKTHNILVSSDGTLKIADFGLAAVKNSTFLSGGGKAVLGTAAFMAPELFSAGQATEMVDVFSYAIVIWELLTGSVVWHEYDNVMQIVMAVGVRGDRPGIPLGCPPQLETLMAECWSQDAGKRPSFREIVQRIRSMRTDFAKYSLLGEATLPLSSHSESSCKMQQVVSKAAAISPFVETKLLLKYADYM